MARQAAVDFSRYSLLPAELEVAIRAMLRPGRVSVLAVTGPSGAGKTCVVAPAIVEVARRGGMQADQLELDSFFWRSSQDRAAWLAEGERLGSDEAARRRDPISWWNFRAANEAVNVLRRGKPLRLSGTYNRADGGRLTGTVAITPPSTGMLVVFEGVAVAHLRTDRIVYVHAPRGARLGNLIQRDNRRTVVENIERFRLNDEFERRYFRSYWARIDFVVKVVGKDKRVEMADSQDITASRRWMARR